MKERVKNLMQEMVSDMRAKEFAKADKKFLSLKKPDEIFEAIKAYMALRDENSGTVMDGLDSLAKEQIADLVKLALEDLRKKRENNTPEPKWTSFIAEGIIEEVSYIHPAILHEHLESIFELQPNASSYTNSYPFRNMPKDKIEIFKNKLNGDLDADMRLKTLEYLSESRDSETVEFVYEYMRKNEITGRWKGYEYENYPLAHMERAGFSVREGKIVSYCPNKPFFLVFEKDYLYKSSFHKRSFQEDANHYDWKPSDKKYRFGGALDDDEQNPLCRIITFDEIPEGLNIRSLKRITLATHLREDMEQIFYQHDDEGNPSRLGVSYGLEEEYRSNNYPLRPTWVSLSPVGDKFIYQPWEGHLHRIGGEPVWIQGADVPVCPECGEKMDFLLQINTGLPDTDTRYEDGEVYFGSGGILYVFWCDRSKVSCTFSQWT
jgi:hypothetical protein